MPAANKVQKKDSFLNSMTNGSEEGHIIITLFRTIMMCHECCNESSLQLFDTVCHLRYRASQPSQETSLE